MKRLKIFVYAILAGIAISFGGTVFLSTENRYLGAALFTAGLFTICTFGFNLFTGKVCYAFEKDREYVQNLPIIWVGNLLGTWLIALIEKATRLAPVLEEKAQALSSVKLNDSILSLFILAVLCNILIFIAVDNFNNNPHEFGKYIGLFFGVMVFIFCGFEHCVADMYYFSMAGVWNLRSFGYIIVISLGNAAGGVIIPLLRSKLKEY